jgi:hypothetical protein
MDQKNTIVKCNRSPRCLFEYNGVCDNYVINIDADGQCMRYVETASEGINVTAPAPKPGSLNICYWCDYFNSNIKKCYCKNPILTPGECHSCKSTGGNR